MKVEGIIWLEAIIEKLAVKHSVETYEVEEALENNPKIRFAKKGDRQGEDAYIALSQYCTEPDRRRALPCGAVHLQNQPRRPYYKRT